ncbi:MAG: hypothetical protein HYU31_06420 [Deltaproteobacteria bacterium]|nr:hypothetical protein [Deltaproteobacteria bacterium]
MLKLRNLTVVILAVLLSGFFAVGSRGEDAIEKAGIATGVTAGNMWFLPIKAISLSMGALSGALSFLLTGNADLSKQIWEDTLQGPYAITPDVAKQAVGDRPELREKK